jgi:energy-coupling factor transporter ATP-binding protein EcfA2
MSDTASAPAFRSLVLKDWRQFADIDLQFHPQLTVVTGANAAGKTTLLGLLGTHFGWSSPLVGTPAKRRRGGPLSFLSGLWRPWRSEPTQGTVEIGQITYSNGQLCGLQVPDLMGSPSVQRSFQWTAGTSGSVHPVSPVKFLV